MLVTRRKKRAPEKPRPATIEPSIRLLRGHTIYWRPEPCPICGEPTRLHLTGTPGLEDEVWTWLQPHPPCVLRDLLGRTSTREVGINLTSKGVAPTDILLPLGTVRVGSAVWGRPERYREALDRHQRGDFGTFGRLGLLPLDLEPWCPGAFDVAIRNALTLAQGEGFIWSRCPATEGRIELVVLSVLIEGETSTLVIPSSLLRSKDLDPEGLPDLTGFRSWWFWMASQGYESRTIRPETSRYN